MSIFGSINMLGAFFMNNRSQFPCEPEPFLLRRKTRFSRGRSGFLYMCSSCSIGSTPVPKPFHTYTIQPIFLHTWTHIPLYSTLNCTKGLDPKRHIGPIHMGLSVYWYLLN
jgi:hypothetical protein